MIKTSTEYKEMIAGNRILHHEAKIEFADETVLTPSDAELFTFKISDNTSNQDSFDIGAVIANQLELRIDNVNGEYNSHNFSGAKITAKVGLELSGGKIEWLKKGIFYAEPGTFSGDTVSVVGTDSMTKFDSPYSKSNLQYPATLGQIVRDACNVCDVSMSADIASFPQDDFVVTNRPVDSSLTFRQILQYVGEIACLFFKINTDDKLTASWYDIDTLESENIENNNQVVKVEDYTGTIETDDVVITGIKVIEENTSESETEKSETEYTYGSEGYILEIEENKLIQDNKGLSVSEYIGKKVNGMRFRPLSIKIPGNAAIEAGDIAVITDRKGAKYKTVLTGVTYTAKALQELTCGAKSPERLSTTRYSKATQVYKELRKKAQQQRSELEKALEDLQNAMKENQGLYPVSEVQEDGSTVLYFCNKPTLKDSDVIIKFNASGWGMSTDGGKTWNIGALVDGTMITKILDSIGINAEWITTGALTVKDADGNITFSVDVETGEVYISSDDIQISGKTLSDKISEIENTAASAKNMSMELSNEYQAIPVDSDGNYTNFPQCSTQATVFYGNSDITNECSYTTKLSSVQGTWNNSTHTYTINKLSDDSGYVDITAKYTTLTITRRFTISKLYAGQRGLQGIQGEKGEQGIAGKDGTTGKTSYFHIKYSSVANPTSSSQMKETPDTYIGTYVDFTESDSSDPKKYTWSQFKGSQGEKGDQGIPGVGEDGKTSYLHIAYANSSDGKTGFSVSDSTNKLYIGQYTDFTKSDSTDPAKYSWSKIKGDDGAAGRTYFIEPSVNALKRSKDNAISPSSITFSAYYRDGSSALRSSYSGRFIIEETSNGSSWKTLYTSSSNESSLTKTISNLGVSNSATSIRCKLYAAGGTSQMLDMQSCVILVDVDNLTQQEIFNILTNNGNKKGLYMSGSELYINANYIVAGILADKNKNTYFDLDKGELVTKLARIGGWTVNNAAIYKDVVSGDTTYRVYFQPPLDNNPAGTYVLSCQKKTGSGSFVADFVLYSSGKAVFGTTALNSDGSAKFGNALAIQKSGIIDTTTSEGRCRINGNRIYFGVTSPYSNGWILKASSDERLGIFHTDSGGTNIIVAIQSGSTSSSDEYNLIVNQRAHFKTYVKCQNLYADYINGKAPKSRIVDTENYDQRKLYCYEMPTPYFGDIGEGVLDDDGKCIIMLDDIFSETVTTSIEYQVFLQKEGKGDVWVERKELKYFEVVGTPGLKFAWEIKAKQIEYEYDRLEVFSDTDLNEPDYEEQAANIVEDFYKELEEVQE